MSVTKVQRFSDLVKPVSPKQSRVEWTDSAGSHHVDVRSGIVIGSAAESAIVVSDPAVSRIHAELYEQADGLWIRDLGSRNGTFVNSVCVAAARLADDAAITVGSTVLSVRYKPAGADPAALWPQATFGPLVGASRSMRKLFAYLAQVAGTNASVLIQGETGTGKDLVARAIHERSPRATQPLVVVDCAALPENLIESELFGHVRGSFTGAVSHRVGALEAADGGTVFLDEVGELPLALQPRLLRALETRTIRRVGETKARPIDVRFIAATHRDVRRMVNAGAFREDLYFRLAVLPVLVPPLRERLEDVPALVRHFLGPGVDLEPELQRELMNRSWLGNVRELRNFVERARVMGAREALTIPSDDPPRTSEPPRESMREGPVSQRRSGDVDGAATGVNFDDDFKSFRERWIEAGERQYVRRLLESRAGNVNAAAQHAGIDRTYLYRLIRKHGL